MPAIIGAIECCTTACTWLPFFVPYWKQATDGFDILLADPSLVGVGIINDNEPYYVDWIVVQKKSE